MPEPSLGLDILATSYRVYYDDVLKGCLKIYLLSLSSSCLFLRNKVERSLQPSLPLPINASTNPKKIRPSVERPILD